MMINNTISSARQLCVAASLFLAVLTMSSIAGEWSAIGTMSEARATFHAFAMSDRIYVVTGADGPVS